MKKRQDIVLNIPQPCSQDWDKMTVNEKGRHCSSCNKTVVDFSNYTDKELAEFFKKAKGEVCGRINNYQANRPILITEQANRSIFYKLLYGTALASWLGIASTANAQSNNTTTQTEQKKIGEVKRTEHSNPSSDSLSIRGILTDSATHEVIPFANIVLENDGIQTDGVVTDINGYYKIQLSDWHLNKHIFLLAVYTGYIDKKIELNLSNLPVKLNITLKRDTSQNGKVIIHDMYVGKMDYRRTETKDDKKTKDMKVINVDSIKARPGAK